MNLEFPQNTELVLVSDVHLREPDGLNAKRLVEIIQAAAKAKVPYMILLGDIFDFCFGARKYFKNKYSAVGRALEDASRSGCKVMFFEGNHEFGMDKVGWAGVEFIPDGNRVIKLPSGTKVKLAHGDLVYSNLNYRLFRAFVRSTFVRILATMIPAKWLDNYALTHAKVSRATDVYRDLDHEKLLADANRWLDAEECDHGVFGHFHFPYDEPRKNAKGRILSVESWAKPNILTFVDGKFKRFTF